MAARREKTGTEIEGTDQREGNEAVEEKDAEDAEEDGADGRISA